MTPLSDLLNGSGSGILNTMQTRGQGVEFIIDRNAAEIVLDRAGTLLDAQTVMITGIASASETGSESGRAAVSQVMVLFKSTGDVQRHDRFTYNAVPTGRLNYEIIRVEKAFNGMIQTFAEVL